VRRPCGQPVAPARKQAKFRRRHAIIRTGAVYQPEPARRGKPSRAPSSVISPDASTSRRQVRWSLNSRVRESG
jgi:hypothetical protein